MLLVPPLRSEFSKLQRKPRGPSKDVSDQFFNSLQLTRHQARQLATELMLFAEEREVEEI